MDQNNLEHKDIEYICPICKKELFLQETFEKMICPFCNNEISIGEKDKSNISSEEVQENSQWNEPPITITSTIPGEMGPVFGLKTDTDHQDRHICSACGKVDFPNRNLGMGLLKAIACVLIVPLISIVIGAIGGTSVLHDNSMFLSMFFMGSFGIAWAILKGAWIGACPSCGIEPMVLLSSTEGQHIQNDIKFGTCPKCKKSFKLDTLILKNQAKQQSESSFPCPSCHTMLPVNMSGLDIIAEDSPEPLNEQDLAQLTETFSLSSSEDLKAIYAKRETDEYRQEAIEAVRCILVGRGELK